MKKPFDLSKSFPQRDACMHVILTSVFWHYPNLFYDYEL